MKTTTVLALAGAAVAGETAYWGDAPVDPTTTTSSTWADYDPTTSSSTWADYTPVADTSSSTWADYDPSATSTETWSDVAIETTTVVETWQDVTVTSTIYDPTWSDAPVADTTSSSVWADASPVDPASTWADCSVVTVTVTGTDYVWTPDAASTGTWADADPTTWADNVDPTTTSSSVWEDNTPAPATTTAASWTKPAWTTSTKTTTKSTAAPKPTGAVCPNDNGKTLPASGSCGGSFQINCGVKATPGASSKFWQKTAGQKVSTLAACIAICDENSKCESVLWVNESSSSDYQLCWQVSGLGPVTGSGYAQIAYKTGASGKCAASYNS